MIIDIEAKTMSTAKRSIISNDLVTTKSPILNISSGIAGTINARVANTATIEGMPKMMAVFRFISPRLYFGKLPTRLVAPTINKE